MPHPVIVVLREEKPETKERYRNVEFEREEIDLLDCEPESIIPELRGIMASGGRKDLRDEMRKDKVKLMEILEKLKTAA